MKQWEYLTLKLEKEDDALMNALGQEGWELVAGILGHTLFFKREFQEKAGEIGRIVDTPTPDEEKIAQEREKDYSLEGVLKKNE